MSKIVLIPLLPMALMGCSTIESITGGDTAPAECNATSSQSFVGQKANADLGAQVKKASGSDTLRWLPPNTAVTMEYSATRVNIAYDEKMVVTRITCG